MQARVDLLVPTGRRTRPSSPSTRSATGCCGSSDTSWACRTRRASSAARSRWCCCGSTCSSSGSSATCRWVTRPASWDRWRTCSGAPRTPASRPAELAAVRGGAARRAPRRRSTAAPDAATRAARPGAGGRGCRTGGAGRRRTRATRSCCSSAGLLDFGDQVSLATRLLRERPAVAGVARGPLPVRAGG